MKIYVEKSLRNFDFWGGAQVNAEHLTADELDMIEEYMEEAIADGEEFSETDVNDFVWFEDEAICDIIGITEEEWEARFAE